MHIDEVHMSRMHCACPAHCVGGMTAVQGMDWCRRIIVDQNQLALASASCSCEVQSKHCSGEEQARSAAEPAMPATH